MKIEAKIEAGESGEIIEGQVDVSVTTDEVKVEVKEEAPADEGQCPHIHRFSALSYSSSQVQERKSEPLF